MKKSILALVAAMALTSGSAFAAIQNVGTVGLEWNGFVPAQTNEAYNYFIENLGLVDIDAMGKLQFKNEKDDGVTLESATQFSFAVRKDDGQDSSGNDNNLEGDVEDPRIAFRLALTEYYMTTAVGGDVVDAGKVFNITHDGTPLELSTDGAVVTPVDEIANITLKGIEGETGLGQLKAGDDVTVYAFLAITEEEV